MTLSDPLRCGTSVNSPKIVGVMGGGNADPAALKNAYELGSLIAREGWVLLNGGRNAGIMDASARGAAEAGGLVIGILPDDHRKDASPWVTIPILTGMGSARNNINVLSSHVVVACPGGAGTISEIALALKAGRPMVLLDFIPEKIFESYHRKGLLHYAQTPGMVIEWIKAL